MGKTRRQVQAEVNEIGRFLAVGMTDVEIMQRLNLRRTQYYVYRKRLFDQSAEVFEQTRLEDLAWHKELLHDRLTRLFREGELLLTARRQAANPESVLPAKELANILETCENIAINIFKLESEGLRIVRNGSLPSLVEQQTNGYLTDTKPRSSESVLSSGTGAEVHRTQETDEDRPVF